MTNNTAKNGIDFPFSIRTQSAEETETLGRTIASAFLAPPENGISITDGHGNPCGTQESKQRGGTSHMPRFIALYGDLGAGKTAFVRGFVSALAPGARVKSPTFALVHEYHASPLPVFHFDMYRIVGDDDLYSTGFYDYLTRGGVIITEWSENIPFALPELYIKIEIQKDNPENPDSRRILGSIVE